MPERSILDIDFSKSEQYTLSIRLSTDGFSFSVYNPIHDSSISFFEKEIDQGLSLAANLKAAFKEFSFLSYSYKQVNVLMISKRFTFMPLELFNGEQAATYFHYNHSPKENEIILHNTLQRNGCMVIFGMDKSAFLFLKERYPHANFYSPVSSLAEHFSVKSKLGNTRKMYVYLRSECIELYCYERGHLMLVNSYACKNTEDRVYYLLYAWKHLGMDQERDELRLTGELVDKERLIQELRKFIQQVFIVNPSSEFNRSMADRIDTIPFDLQVLFLQD